MIWRCDPRVGLIIILEACQPSPVGGYRSGTWSAHKIFQCSYYWPTIYKNAHDYAKACDQFQRQGNISKRQELPMTTVLEINLFNVWGIYFIGTFVSSHGMKYDLVAVAYVSRWVDVVFFQTIKGRVSQYYWERIYFPCLGNQGLSLVIEACTFVIVYSRSFLRNIM